jgi:hypothetical protein
MLVTAGCTDSFLGLGNGYEISRGNEENQYIYKNDHIAVRATIVDYDMVGNYVVGLRFPAIHYKCGSGYNIRLKNERRYFILSVTSGEVNNISALDEFTSMLDNLGIRQNTNLNYARFDEIWNRYSKYYLDVNYTNCELESVHPRQ